MVWLPRGVGDIEGSEVEGILGNGGLNYGEEETKEEEKVWSHGLDLDLEVGREMGGIECIEAAKGCMHVC